MEMARCFQSFNLNICLTKVVKIYTKKKAIPYSSTILERFVRTLKIKLVAIDDAQSIKKLKGELHEELNPRLSRYGIDSILFDPCA